MTDDDRTRGIPLTPHTHPIALRKPAPQYPQYPAPHGYPRYPAPPASPQYPTPGWGPAQAYSPPMAYAPPQQPFYGSTTMIARPAPNAALIAIAWIIAVSTFFYMLPWAVAATRGKSNQLAIGLVNLLLGWSFIGWIVALVMACGAEPAPTIVIQQHHYGNVPYRY